MQKFTPSGKEETGVTSIGGLTLDHCSDPVRLSGSLDITRDQAGLQNAVAMRALLGLIEAKLDKKTNCPWKVLKKTGPFVPFANESDTCQIGELTLENRLDRVALYGELTIPCNLTGLADTVALTQLLDQIIAVLRRDRNLVAKIQVDAPTLVPNPFAPS